MKSDPSPAHVLVLKQVTFGEADLILQTLASDGRRLAFIARSAKKSQKRFGGGVLEPGCHLRVEYLDRKLKHGGDSELFNLKEAKLIYGFPHLRTSWQKLNAALEILKTIAEARDLDGKEIYDLVGHSLKGLEIANQPDRHLTHFQIRLLALQGVLPPEGPWTELGSLPVREFTQRNWDDIDWVEMTRIGSKLLKQFMQGLQTER